MARPAESVDDTAALQQRIVGSRIRAGLCVFVCIGGWIALLTQDDVGDDKSEDEDSEEGEGENEQVEEAVVSFSHAVAHPWAVVVEALW